LSPLSACTGPSRFGGFFPISADVCPKACRPKPALRAESPATPAAPAISAIFGIRAKPAASSISTAAAIAHAASVLCAAGTFAKRNRPSRLFRPFRMPGHSVARVWMPFVRLLSLYQIQIDGRCVFFGSILLHDLPVLPFVKCFPKRRVSAPASPDISTAMNKKRRFLSSPDGRMPG
jgi:hypothetical protein